MFVNDLMNQLIKEDYLRRTMKNHGNKLASRNTERRVFMIKDKTQAIKKVRIKRIVTNKNATNEAKSTHVKLMKKLKQIKEFVLLMKIIVKGKKWLLDFDASTHACNSYSLFENIKIIVGENREVVVTGRSTVKLRVKSKN